MYVCTYLHRFFKLRPAAVSAERAPVFVYSGGRGDSAHCLGRFTVFSQMRKVDAIPIQIHCEEVVTTERGVNKK